MRPPELITAPLPAARDAASGADDLVDAAARARAYAQRRRNIQIARVSVAVVFLAAWEILTQLEIADVFFFGQPSGIINQIWRWVTRGTAQGALWGRSR